MQAYARRYRGSPSAIFIYFFPDCAQEAEYVSDCSGKGCSPRSHDVLMFSSASAPPRGCVGHGGRLQSLAQVELHEEDEGLQAQHVAALVQALDAVGVVQVCAGRPKFFMDKVGSACSMAGPHCSP